MYGRVYSAVTEGFAGHPGGTSSAGETLVGILAVIVVVAIQLFLIKFLWNNVLTKCVSVVRPLKTILETIGLLILISSLNVGIGRDWHFGRERSIARDQNMTRNTIFSINTD